MTGNKIKKILDEGFKMRCVECGAVLPSYPCYDDKYEIYICPDCGKMYRVKRREGR